MQSRQLFSDYYLPTYLIKFRERQEDFTNIRQQFESKDEFDLTIVEACNDKVEKVGLWLSIKKIIRTAIDKGDDVVIICGDYHEFTPQYSREGLFSQIIGAADQGANILLGGVRSFGQAIPISKDRFWLDRFQGTQFTIIYRSFFQQILYEPFDDKEELDEKLSHMTSHKMVIYPFISVQPDTPTSSNIEQFRISEMQLKTLIEIASTYGVDPSR